MPLLVSASEVGGRLSAVADSTRSSVTQPVSTGFERVVRDHGVALVAGQATEHVVLDLLRGARDAPDPHVLQLALQELARRGVAERAERELRLRGGGDALGAAACVATRTPSMCSARTERPSGLVTRVTGPRNVPRLLPAVSSATRPSRSVKRQRATSPAPFGGGSPRSARRRGRSARCAPRPPRRAGLADPHGLGARADVLDRRCSVVWRRRAPVRRHARRCGSAGSSVRALAGSGRGNG